ncbi:MAG: Hsp20/alpha crystallin family protein [Chloroflexi bacterium]|nr:Hsp20/alpha crystallin family protein [Chloroflexota bacterium]
MNHKAADIFAEFERVRERMEQAWKQMLGPPGSPRFCPPVLEPPADVYETEDAVIVVLDIAGIGDQEVEISVEGKTISVRGEREAAPGRPGRLYSQMEICYGPFVRELLLPADVDPDGVKATYNDGLLEIVLPKVKRQINRQVRIVAG